jgi:hypothetical protein
MKQPDNSAYTDVFDSINSKEDIIPFLLDLLKTIVGGDGLKEAIGGLLTTVIGNSEEVVKEAFNWNDEFAKPAE